MNATALKKRMAGEVAWTTAITVDPAADLRRGQARLRRRRVATGAGLVMFAAVAGAAVPVAVGALGSRGSGGPVSGPTASGPTASGPAASTTSTASTPSVAATPPVLADGRWVQLSSGVWFRLYRTSDGLVMYQIGKTPVQDPVTGAYFYITVEKGKRYSLPVSTRRDGSPVTSMTLLRGDVRSAEYEAVGDRGTVRQPARVYRLATLPGWVLVYGSYRSPVSDNGNTNPQVNFGLGFASWPRASGVELMPLRVKLDAYDAHRAQLWLCLLDRRPGHPYVGTCR